MSRFKRVLSFILTMVMLVGMIPPLGISVSAAAYDTVPSVYRSYEEGEQGQDGLTIDRELKRLAVLKLDLNGGVYYHTEVTHTEDWVSKDKLLIEDGFSGTINIRIYHSQYGRDNDCRTGRPSHTAYGDYIGMPYINGVCMANDDLDLCDLLVTLFYSIYNVDEDNAGNITVSQLVAFDFNSGAATNQAYVYPSTFTDGDLSPNVLFGDSDDVDSWKMPCVWGHPDEFEGKAVTLYAGPEGNGKSVSVELYDNSRDDIDYLLPINEKVIKELYGFYPENGSSDQRVFIGWAESYDESSHQGIGEMYDKGNINYRGNSDSLYAIWGYPIMFDADGGTFKDADGMLYENGSDEYLSYVADYAEWKGEDTDPASMYRYNMPDWNGYTVEKPGARRVGNGAGPNGEGYAYGLINADGTFFTWEGYDQNLTIPPTGGAYYPDTGNANGATWDMFRCTDLDDLNNPYGIRFPEFLAIWEPSVTYYPNGGTGEMPTDWLEWDYTKPYSYKDYVIRGCIYTKENAHFTGWNTSPDGTGYSYAPEDVINKLSSSDPIKLYAQWSDNSYEPEGDWTVTLDPYGGAIGSITGSNGTLSNGMLVCPAELGQTYGEIIGTLPTPTRDGYYFDGWWYEQDDVYYDAPGHIHAFEHNGQMVYKYGKGWFLDLDAKFVAPQNVTFHAKWVQITNVKNDGSGSYNMYYDPDGYLMEDGDVKENVRVTGGKMITEDTFKINKGETYKSAFGGVNAVPMAVKRGYTLAGWIYMPYWFVLSIGETYGLTYDGTFEALWAKIEHECEWVNISVTPATCEAEGTTIQGCVCGETKTVTTAIKPHSYTIPWGVAEQATCTTNRIDIYLCDICKVETTEKEAPDTALGHDWGPWYYPAEEDMPTCEGTGLQVRDCQREDCFVIDQQVTDPIGHDYVGTVVPAFCDCEETILYICQNDPSHQYTEATGGEGALGHIFGNPYDLGNGYTRTECIRESDGVNPDCPHYVDTPNRYNIIYDLVLPTATYGTNTPYWHTYDTETVLVDPTAANATFAGWYLDREYTQPITAIGAQDILAPVKVYAKWTLTLKLDGVAKAAELIDKDGVSLGAGVDYTITYVYGESVEIPYEWWHNTVTFTGWTNTAIETIGQLGTVPAGAFTVNATLTATYVNNTFPIKYYDVMEEQFITMDTDYITNETWVSSFTYGDSATVKMTVPTRRGYTGTVYKTRENAEAFTSAITGINRNTVTRANYPDEEIVFYVNWKPLTPTLTLHDMNGTATILSTGKTSTDNQTYKITYDQPYKISDYYTYAYTGYVFLGWDTASTGYNVVYAPDHQFDGTEFIAATMLYAVWAPEEMTITLDPNGGQLYDPEGGSPGSDKNGTITYTYGTGDVNIADFYPRIYQNTKTFTGWKLSTTSAIITDGIITAEMLQDNAKTITLTAQWATNVFPIKYYDIDFEQFITMDTEYVTNTSWVSQLTYGSSSNQNITVPTRTGYTGTVHTTRELAETNGTSITKLNRVNLTYTNYPDGEVVLYVTWTPKKYNLSLNLLGGTGTTIANGNTSTSARPLEYTYDTSYKISDFYEITQTGFKFLGWDTVATGYNVVYEPDHQFYGNEFETTPINLYAVWAPETMTITLDPNGGQLYAPDGSSPGSDKNGTITYTYGTGDVDISEFYSRIYQNTKTFTGWKLSTTSAIITDGIITAEMLQDNAKTITLTAQWATNVFPIKYYDIDNEQFITMDTDYVTNTSWVSQLTYGSSSNQNITVPTRIGYVGTVHTTRDLAEANGTAITKINRVNLTYTNYPAGEVVLYVTWTPMVMTMAYRNGGASSDVSAANMKLWFGEDYVTTVNYPDVYVLPTTATREGYHFAGFYAETGCTTRIYEIDTKDVLTTASATKRIFIKWEALEDTPPTGKIDLGVGTGGVSTEFIEVDDIRYGIYAQSYPNVTIIGDKDSTNYVPPKVEYFLVENGAMTWDEVVNVNEDRWIEAENGVPFSLEGTPDGEYIMYVRLTDDQGNVNFISSQRFVIDNVAPDFVELEGGEYCFNEELENALNGYKFTVVEKYPDKITINGIAQDYTQLSDNEYTLEGGENGTDYVVYAKDKAGNETTVTVKIYGEHDWTDWYIENAEDCLNDGNDRRDCQRCGEVETQVRPALGHDWKATTYTFTGDGKSCEAVRICNRDASHVESETATVDNGHVTSAVTKDPTCTEKGETTYTADFVADWAPENPTKTVADIDSLGHTEGEVVVENNVDPKCIETGSYDNVVYCTVCKVELSRDTVTVPATGHKWGETTYEWDGYTKCTATRICEYQTGTACTETETTENITDEVTTPLVCDNDGERTYTAHFANEWAGESTTTEVIPAEPDNVNVHEDPELTIVEDTANCIEDGERTIKWVCNTCLCEGKYTEFSPATGHNWGETVYTWNWEAEDGKVICTATRKCSNNTTAECEQAKPSEATAVEDTYVAPNCTEAGSEDYYAPFNDEYDWTEPQTETKVIPALGHTDGEPVEDATTLKKAECGKDGSVDVVKHCTVCGVETYRQAQRIPTIQSSEQGGHTWSEWIVSKPATYFEAGEEYRYCTNAEIFGNPDRFIDCCSKETREIPALKDSTVPELSVSASGHDITDTKVDYDNDGTVVTIKASDADSGLKSVTYTVTKDGVVIETVEAEIVDGKVNVEYPVNSNGEYVITVTAVDKLNNERTVTSDKIVIDTDAPVITPEATESFDEIKVKVEDKYLDKVVVIANGEEVEYTPDENGYITIPDSDSTTTSYTIVATDKAGNSATVYVTIKFDGEEPVPSITTDLENVNHNDGEADYTNDSDVVVIITAEDNEGGSGVDHIDYVITDENGNVVEEGVYDENNKPVLDKEGKYTVYATATDAQGNTTNTPVYIDVIVVDYTIPVINSTTNGDRSVTVNVTDNNGYVTATVNGTEVTLDENGNYIIPANNTTEDKVYEIVATDKAGNVTDTVVITVPGDKTGPSITAKDDENKDLNDETVDYDADGAVEITIEATDTESGVNEITYVIYDENNNKIGEGTYDSENKPVINVVDENGNLVDGKYTVEVTVTDNAGNETKELLDTIIVDVTAPEILLPENNCTDENTYCVPENNTITINIIENNVESIVVKVNGEVNDQYIGKTLNLTGSDTGTTYEITVIDMVGNITETTVVIYGTHAWNNGEVTTEPTCLDTGIMTYTCTRCGETKTEVIPATGHDWGKATYNWSDDGKSCNATRVCNNDISHVETASAAVTAEQTKAPTCAVMGETTYTATFEETWAEAQTTTRVDVAIDPANHDGHLVQVAAKTPTCTEIGWNAYEYCTECDYTTYEEIPATDHNWDDVTYTWSEDGKSCTAKRVCKNDESHVETATAVVTSEVTTPATCVDKGTTTYTASFTVEWAQPQTTTRDDVTEDSDNHVALEQVEAKAPTCTEIGWNAYEKCDKCGYTTYVELPANGHPKKHGFKEEIVKEMTDNKDGTYSDGLYYVIEYCKVCDHVFSKTEYKLHPVAQNVETGKLYADLQTALFEAAAGDTVKILEDLIVHDVTALTSGYLDLNGHMLETYTLSTGMSTHFVDSSEGNKGHLVVGKEGQTINPSNCDFPVYVSFTAEDGTVKDGYRFFDTILLQQLTPKFTEDEKTGSKFVSVTFRPIIQDAATSKELLGDGGADNKIKIGLVFSVTDKNGVQSDIMHWICLDTLIETVYTNNRAIMVTLTGIEAYETITIGSVLISETLGVEMTTYEKDGKTYSTIGTYDIATGTAIEA